MKKYTFLYAAVVVGVAFILGFILNFTSGKTWSENVENMTSVSKLVTYLAMFIGLFVWKNWDNFKKS